MAPGLAFADSPGRFRRTIDPSASFALLRRRSRHLAEITKLHLDRKLPNAVGPKFTLHHEALPALADEDKKADDVPRSAPKTA
jgi:hypothetical protein